MAELDPAPDSPRVRTWNRRIMSWGCAPAMAVGLVGGVVTTARPEMAQTLAAAGAGLAIVGAGPIALHAWRLRRDNRRRWRAARAEARERDMKVDVHETDEGDHEYRLVERETIEPLPWQEESGRAPGEAGGGEAGDGDAAGGQASDGDAGGGDAGGGDAGDGNAGGGDAGGGDAGDGNADDGEGSAARNKGPASSP